MDVSVLKEAFRKAGIDVSEKAGSDIPRDRITKNDLYELGFYGGENSSEKRKALLKYYDLPSLLTTSSIVEILNSMITREEFYLTAGKLQ